MNKKIISTIALSSILLGTIWSSIVSADYDEYDKNEYSTKTKYAQEMRSSDNDMNKRMYSNTWNTKNSMTKMNKNMKEWEYALLNNEILSLLSEDEKSQIKELLDEKRANYKINWDIKDKIKEMSPEERQEYMREKQSEMKERHNEMIQSIREILSNNSEALEQFNEITSQIEEKMTENRSKMEEKQSVNEEKRLKIEQYKETFELSLWSKLDNMDIEKLNIILKRINDILPKFNKVENENIYKIIALKQMIIERLETDITNDNFNIEDLLQ